MIMNLLKFRMALVGLFSAALMNAPSVLAQAATDLTPSPSNADGSSGDQVDRAQPAASQSAPTRQPSVRDANDLSHLNLQALKQTQNLIPNLHLVTPFLLRGAQPSQQALSLLKESGVKTIINLRNEPIVAAQEKAQADGLSLQYANIPMDVFSRPSDASIQKFLAIVNNPANQPVYVHCLHGQDRTGTMCGIYRLTQQNWTFDKTYQEMIGYGFKPMFGQLTQTVYSFANDRTAKNVPASYLVQDVQNRMRKFLK